MELCPDNVFDMARFFGGVPKIAKIGAMEISFWAFSKIGSIPALQQEHISRKCQKHQFSFLSIPALQQNPSIAYALVPQKKNLAILKEIVRFDDFERFFDATIIR